MPIALISRYRCVLLEPLPALLAHRYYTRTGIVYMVSLVSRIRNKSDSCHLQIVAPKFSAFPRREIVLLLYIGGAGFGLEIPCTVWSKATPR